MLNGSMVALVTPMKADTSLDWDALHKLVDWHLQQGTHAIVAVGTTGESATLSMQEHIEVIRKVVDQVNGRIPVIAGTGANSTSEALELTEGAKSVNADACLLVTPYYNKPSQEGLYQHHKYIADRVAIPQLLYNVPGRTAVDMLPDTVARLALVNNIIGIKEATGSMQRLQDIKDRVRDDFLLLSGDDGTALEFMRLGGDGEISVTANVVPAKTSKICELVAAGRVEDARAIDASLAQLHQALFLEANPIPVKWAVARMGMMGQTMRLPLTPLAEAYWAELEQAMQLAGAI
ncbi:4-hydroxy-tetrahydrodipicolinate synthase [Teredinibacter waterburyi]|jgi:dihydrodipicolinate synthase (EC 4.2.1.52)|uniref:4-hydroxy-tetrahydrodipicolinate synthase n=1 Tax=Teredinibacter waterburyi TaxID=1500538 RepID=UPI00165EC927|nr:4-hydroxy-tetrahydrodipicolinate synthase [Teredinibacter waterburyi]